MTLCLLPLLLAQPAPPPRLARGDELVWRGEVALSAERGDERFRKQFDLELRALVLESTSAGADLAVMTAVRPRADAAIAAAAAQVTGRAPPAAESTVAVERLFVRADGASCAAPVPLDAPPALEWGVIAPPAPGGATEWSVAEPGRPAQRWATGPAGVWNGGRAARFTMVQETPDFDRPARAHAGWRRTDELFVSPADGVAVSVARRIVRREGASEVGRVECRYELRPTNRLGGERFAEARREAEAALQFQDDLRALAGRPAADLRARRLRLERAVRDAAPGGFRPALDALVRRCRVAEDGGALPAAPAVRRVEVPELDAGQSLPDFAAPRLLSPGSATAAELRGRPAVLVFVKPGGDTSAQTFAVAEALHRHFAGKVNVWAVAVAAPPATAVAEHRLRGLSLPLLDGAALKDRCGVATYPRWFVADAAGVVVWRFDGVGDETGYLAKEQAGKLLPGAAVAP